MSPLPVCSCSCCDSWDYLNGHCSYDKQQHGPDESCAGWEKPKRRDLLTGKPFEPQEINDPPEWERIKKNGNF